MDYFQKPAPSSSTDEIYHTLYISNLDNFIASEQQGGEDEEEGGDDDEGGGDEEGGDDEESKCPTGKCQQQEEGGQQKDDPMMDGTADAYDLEKPSNACDESMAKCQSRVGKFFGKK